MTRQVTVRAGWMLGALLLATPALAQPTQPAQPRPAPLAQPPAAQPPAAQSRPFAPAPAPAAQQPPAAAAAAAERSWRISCAETPAEPPRNCQLSAFIILRPQNQRLAQVVLTRQPETRSLTLVFQMPHGTLLPSGMTWQVDEGETQRLAFQTSDADGIYAGLPVADDLLALLRRGTTLKLTFVVAARREALTVPIPLAQFSESVTELFAAERAPAR